MSGSTPHGYLYLAVAARIMEAVTTEGCDLNATMPACPDWSVRDLTGTHEADLDETLDPNRRPPPDAVAAGLAGAIGRWRQHLADAKVPPLEVVAPDVRDWWIGQPGDDHVTVRADAYYSWRYRYGPTSRERVEEFAWSRGPSPYLDLGLPHPFQFPGG